MCTKSFATFAKVRNHTRKILGRLSDGLPPLGLGLGCADPPSTGRSQRVVHFWSKCKFDLRKNFSGAKYLQTSGGHNFFILDRHDLKLHQSTQLTVLRRSRIRKGPQTA